jgi:DNA end-binding protein Ku
VKGYQVDPDVYVTMEPEEIEAIRLESKKTIDMVQFVEVSEIDARYLNGLIT